MMKTPPSQNVRYWLRFWSITVGIGLVVLLLFHLRTIGNMRNDTAWVDHTQRVIRNLRRIHINAIDAETTERGFLLTGSPKYLQPYEEIKIRLQEELDELNVLVQDNPTQQKRAEAVRELVNEKLAELELAIWTRQQQGLDNTIDLLKQSGRDAIVRLRAMLQEMIAMEELLLKQRMKGNDQSRNQSVASAILLGLASLLGIGGLAHLHGRHHNKMQLAHDMIIAREAELKQNVLSLETAHAEAEAANQSRGEFLANMSHEIRTPMTAILGHATILGDHLVDPDDLQAVDVIQKQGGFLLQIINDILDLSKIDAGQLTIHRKPVHPAAILADVETLMSVSAADRKLDLTVDFIDKIPDTIQTDPIRIRQILVNLIGNAVKFTDHGGIRVSARFCQSSNRLIIAVADTGIGIPAAQLNALFQPFHQVDSSDTRRVGGTGLGLTICRRLADALGGQLSVTSELGRGSTFMVSIDCGDLTGVPLIDATLQFRPIEKLKPRDIQLAGKILVVDDRCEIRFLAQHLIQKSGGAVITASDGKEAYEMVVSDAQTNPSIDAVLLDMQMPVMDGYEAAAKMRSAGYRGPIIALTANAMVEDRERCLRAGCSDYCTKPIDGVALLTTLKKAIDTQQLQWA